MNLNVRRLAYLVFQIPGFHYLGRWAYRAWAQAFTLLARLSGEIDEVWILGSGGTKDVQPALSDLDFLLVLARDHRDAGLEQKWLKRFRVLFFFYPRATLRHHLFFLSATEWETLHSIFTQRGATRGVPLFQRQRWRALPVPAISAHFALKDRLYRAVGLFHLFQVPLRQHFQPRGWRGLFLTRVQQRLAVLTSSGCSRDRDWTARFLLRLNRLAEDLAPPELPAATLRGPAAESPPEIVFKGKDVVLFSRLGDVDHWIVSPLYDSDFEHVVESYRTSRRRVYLNSPKAYRALYQNFPFVPHVFHDVLNSQLVELPTWDDGDRVAIEVLRLCLAGGVQNKTWAAFEATWTLADVRQRWGIEATPPANWPPLSTLTRPVYN